MRVGFPYSSFFFAADYSFGFGHRLVAVAGIFCGLSFRRFEPIGGYGLYGESADASRAWSMRVRTALLCSDRVRSAASFFGCLLHR